MNKFCVDRLTLCIREHMASHHGFIIKKKLINFTLYPAHSRVGRGNLLLRHSVPHFLPNSGGIACLGAELNAALNLDPRAEKWKHKFKKIFHFLEWGSNPQPVDFTVTLLAVARSVNVNSGASTGL